MNRNEPSAELDRLAHEVIGAAIEVHRHLGAGFLESAYENALVFELSQRGVPFRRQVPVCLMYKEQNIGEGRLDLLVGGGLVVELKAVESLNPVHEAQLFNYLRATGHPLGLLINFNVEVLKNGIRRRVYSG
ncbi:MAG: GxxExxY protein [Planctomycetota bacterium]